mmetsp:Transcript_8171/g.22399  ORF Transcript_8171/g.22399 Transcript_8171/m.22399 type:complete len:466 (+) Transcript_8171:21-1418(+)
MTPSTPPPTAAPSTPLVPIASPPQGAAGAPPSPLPVPSSPAAAAAVAAALPREPSTRRNPDRLAQEARRIRLQSLRWTLPAFLLAVACLIETLISDVSIEHGEHSLSSWGIGKCVSSLSVGSWSLLYTMHLLSPDKTIARPFIWELQRDFANGEDISLPVETRHGLGLADDATNAAEILNVEVDTMRVLRVIMLLGRVLLNVFFILRAFMQLPALNPDVRLNEARHWVGWFELLAMCFFFAGSAFYCRPLYRMRNDRFENTGRSYRLALLQGGGAAGNIRKFVRMASTFSAMQAMASPIEILKQGRSMYASWKLRTIDDTDANPGTESTWRKGLCVLGAILYMAVRTFFACLGVMALLVKVNQVEFETQTGISVEDILANPWGFMSLLGLVSAILGISDVDEQMTLAVFEGATYGEERNRAKDRTEVMRRAVRGYFVVNHSTYKAVVLVLTLSIEDYKRLLFKRR